MTLAERYELGELLGRGGMASVYRATDLASGRSVALKQLTLAADAPERALVEALFEREFHTLRLLQHPRVIAVYDYGVSTEDGAFYTMELLDGGDLRDRAPLPWAEACALIFDVCSSLALLHSRRMLHRDVTPRNVRCTRDGRAKLIDFGALVAMGPAGARVVGTPAFIAPESVHRQVLDGRTDLYALGATLYYALTGRVPFRAANLSELALAWQNKPAPPSAYAAEIPSDLDELVLSLINFDPGARPRSAFDVMQRLAAIAGLTSVESDDVSRAYLTTPALVGRQPVLGELRDRLSHAGADRPMALMLGGVSGIGRSRVLDAALLDAKALGFTGLRANATGALEPFSVAHALLAHLLETLPNLGQGLRCPELFVSAAATDDEAMLARAALKPLAELQDGAEALQRAFCQVFLGVSRSHPLLLAVDDVHRIDQASAAVLAALEDSARRAHLAFLLTADSEGAANDACAVLARRCERLELEPLTQAQTLELFDSLFGDVANLRTLADEVHSVALGNPRQSLDMAQHLVDTRTIRYNAGTWSLPSQLTTGDLPKDADAAMSASIALLSEPARFLAEAHALAFFNVLSHRDYHALLPEASGATIEGAISELLAVRALICDGNLYTLANRVWPAAFTTRLTEQEVQRRHQALANLFAERSTFAHIYHLFLGGHDEAGLDALLRNEAEWDRGFNHSAAQAQNVGKMIWCANAAAETALRLGRSRRQVFQLRRWFAAGIATTESKLFAGASSAWLAQLKHDSGLEHWERDPDRANAGERMMRALQAAHQRYLDTPEGERVYSVPEALRLLAEYVVLSIAVGARSYDTRLVATLPGLLEPFVALSPALDVIWRNATATYRSQCECRHAEAHALWKEVLEKLGTMTDELQHLEPIRGAVTYAVGILEAQFGLASASERATRLDNDPYQKISALQLRKIVRLEQGDWRGADQLRRQAEVLSLQVRTPPMFKSLLSLEGSAYAKARDLVGLAQVIEQLQLLAADYPGWIPHLREAEARFQLVRGDYAAARLGFERCIELTAFAPDELSQNMAVWVSAQGGLAETLLSMGCLNEAYAGARAAVQICQERKIGGHANDLVRILGLIEAKLGHACAAERLDRMIEEQRALGVTGLRLGLSYEARAQIAIWHGDRASFERYSRLTASEYRYGLGCPLGARYQRLTLEAERHGFSGSPRLADFDAAIETALTMADDEHTKVTRVLDGAQDRDEQAMRALRVLCVAWRARTGHLFERTAEGLVLRASLEALTPTTAACLRQQADAFLTQELERIAYLDAMASTVLQDLTSPTTVHVADTRYELLVLSCLQGRLRRVVGVVAVGESGSGARDDERLALIPAVSAQLLEPPRRSAATS